MARDSKSSRSISTLGGAGGRASSFLSSAFDCSPCLSAGLSVVPAGCPFLSAGLLPASRAAFSTSLRAASGDVTSFRSGRTTSRVGFGYVQLLSKLP